VLFLNYDATPWHDRILTMRSNVDANQDGVIEYRL